MQAKEVENKSCITKRKNINALIYNNLMSSYGCLGGLIRIFPKFIDVFLLQSLQVT